MMRRSRKRYEDWRNPSTETCMVCGVVGGWGKGTLEWGRGPPLQAYLLSISPQSDFPNGNG